MTVVSLATRSRVEADAVEGSDSALGSWADKAQTLQIAVWFGFTVMVFARLL